MWVPPAIICSKNQRNYVAINLAGASMFEPSGPSVSSHPPDLQASSTATLNSPPPPTSCFCAPLSWDFYTTQALCARMRLNNKRQAQYELTSRIRRTGDPPLLSRTPVIKHVGSSAAWSSHRVDCLSENFLLCRVFGYKLNVRENTTKHLRILYFNCWKDTLDLSLALFCK